MTLRHLEIFNAICLSGSITKAAENLHISQPTVTVALKELENHYGAPLFDRRSHKLFITPLGETVFDRSKKLLDLWQDLMDAKKPLNKVRIGTGTALGKLILPKAIKAFRELYPNIQVEISVRSVGTVCRELMENSLDFVLAERVERIPGLSSRSIQRCPVVAIAHKDNPLANMPIVTAQDLGQQNLLLREPKSITRQTVDTYFHNRNIPVTAALVSSSVQSLLNATQENLGVCFLSLDHALAYPHQDLVILNVPDFHGECYVNLLFHSGKVFTASMNQFLEFYQSYLDHALKQRILAYNTIHPDHPFIPPDKFTYSLSLS